MTHPSPKPTHCSFCRAELGLGVEIGTVGSRARGQRAPTGHFCSTRCHTCVLALEALHPSPLATGEFIETRARLTDHLLTAWRGGKGPDPELVLEAARHASSGLALAGVPE